MVVTIVVLPLFWPLLRELIWWARWHILALILPAILTPIIMLLVKFFLFGPTWYKNRALASFLLVCKKGYEIMGADSIEISSVRIFQRRGSVGRSPSLRS